MFLKKYILVYIMIGFALLSAQNILSTQDKKAMEKQVCKQSSGSSACLCTNLTIKKSSIYKGEKLELDLNSAMLGHFYSTQHLEAIVFTNGCEPHAFNGGGYLVYNKNKSEKWKLKKYYAGNLGDCRKVTFEKGKSRIICNSSFTAQGYRTEELYMAKLTQNGMKKIATLYRGKDDTFTGTDTPTNTTLSKWWVENNKVIFLVNGKRKTVSLGKYGVFKKENNNNIGENYTITRKKNKIYYKILAKKSCQILFSKKHKVLKNTCNKLINSKGIEIYCAPSKDVCKTKREIYKSLAKNRDVI